MPDSGTQNGLTTKKMPWPWAMTPTDLKMLAADVLAILIHFDACTGPNDPTAHRDIGVL